eukprot:scaffold24136_cov131-Isochrysis_galbana.AAC.6
MVSSKLRCAGPLGRREVVRGHARQRSCDSKTKAKGHRQEGASLNRSRFGCVQGASNGVRVAEWALRRREFVAFEEGCTACQVQEIAVRALRGLVCAHGRDGCQRFARLGLRLFVCCWCLAPENALRHLRTSQDVRRRSVQWGVGKG